MVLDSAVAAVATSAIQKLAPAEKALAFMRARTGMSAPGTDMDARFKALVRENRELAQTGEILRKADGGEAAAGDQRRGRRSMSDSRSAARSPG